MLSMRSRRADAAADADDVLDELAAGPAPAKKRPVAKAARKRRVASPAELAKSPRPRHAPAKLCQNLNISVISMFKQSLIHIKVPLIYNELDAMIKADKNNEGKLWSYC